MLNQYEILFDSPITTHRSPSPLCFLIYSHRTLASNVNITFILAKQTGYVTCINQRGPYWVTITNPYE